MDTSRYEAAIERNLAEMQRALLDLELMRGIEAAGPIRGNEAIGVYYALFNDYIAHCIKVLEDRSGAAAFWYLYRTRQNVFDGAAKDLGISLSPIQEMSEKLKHVRDKTHFHIDRDGVLDPKVVWSDADINGKQLADVALWVWALLNAGQVDLGRENMRLPSVDREAVVRATQVLEGRA